MWGKIKLRARRASRVWKSIPWRQLKAVNDYLWILTLATALIGVVTWAFQVKLDWETRLAENKATISRATANSIMAVTARHAHNVADALCIIARGIANDDLLDQVSAQQRMLQVIWDGHLQLTRDVAEAAQADRALNLAIRHQFVLIDDAAKAVHDVERFASSIGKDWATGHVIIARARLLQMAQQPIPFDACARSPRNVDVGKILPGAIALMARRDEDYRTALAEDFLMFRRDGEPAAVSSYAAEVSAELERALPNYDLLARDAANQLFTWH